ncbi:ATP-binding protein [Paucibacter sp. R3-3]|uniref:histidine kinase n=1 Tax=Roseateles agri TaxID=3098619 RepID=A0ABU5DDX8_9BURK|nr:ATP-binding protein [Paucibacter sp. R3-3]MDY0743955.1 ATP-binding protein [Paucibacter sp. R3-3]
MGGFQRRLSGSIQLRLSLTLSACIIVVAAAAGIVSFKAAFNEAHELQDDVLRRMAQLLQLQSSVLSTATARIELRQDDEDARIIVQQVGAPGPSTADVDHGGPLPVPITVPDGLQTLEVAGESYRMVVTRTAAGQRVAVAQESDFRDEIASSSAMRTVAPILVLVPLLLLAVAHLVRKMFRPIAALSTEIDQRAGMELHPIEGRHVPDEVRPFVVAINHLLARVAEGVGAQRRFVSDAAHELRSPLTALSLQAERLADAEMSAAARERLDALRRGIARNRNLLEQLLTLARAQTSASQPLGPVSVPSVFRRVLEDLMPLAERKGIDIGVEGAQEVWVLAPALDLSSLVSNLVDNALRYTPDGGRVDLSVVETGGQVTLCVTDSGPGIPANELPRVFDPFYRVLGNEQIGSGLGLSIVRAITDRLGAVIEFRPVRPEPPFGLQVIVRFLGTPGAAGATAATRLASPPAPDARGPSAA